MVPSELARRAVLLIPSKSSHPTQLFSRQHYVHGDGNHKSTPYLSAYVGGPAAFDVPAVTLHVQPFSSLPRYLLTSLPLTSRGSPRVACYTVSPMARQRLGQHFLADLHWREEIARAIRVSPHSTVPLLRDDQHCWIEIGSGHGEMTQHLLAAGTPVHTIEID